MSYFFHGPFGLVEIDYRMQDDLLPLRYGRWRHPNPQHWYDIRAQALARDGHRCVMCNDSGCLNVHHRTYERWGCEWLEDVTTLCSSCHLHFHGGRNAEFQYRRAA